MRRLKSLLFILRARLRGSNRVSLGAYLKAHEDIHLGGRCKIHDGAFVDASRGGGIRLGQQVTINRHAMLQGDRGGIALGDRVEINNFTIVNGTGGVTIGDDTILGPGVRIISYQHRYAAGTPIRLQPTDGKRICIGKDVWVGANAVILAGVSIGDGAVVAAGAIVNRDVASNAVVGGVPARVIKMRT